VSNRFADIAFTPSVRAVQESMGSRRHYARTLSSGVTNGPPLGEAELDFISRRDTFYMASVSETDWPYVQHRGGPAGFLKALSPSRLGFADYRGNRQYVSVGNVLKNDRVAIILVDYPNQERLKILGHARVVAAEETALLESLKTPNYGARVERGIVIEVVAYDWNCPQHITPRFTELEIETAIAPLKSRLAQLEADLKTCRESQPQTR
jgi:predicted pyridoxine 5'-phosphate oxidase superfamily flavin-nucleotide-binding protein